MIVWKISRLSELHASFLIQFYNIDHSLHKILQKNIHITQSVENEHKGEENVWKKLRNYANCKATMNSLS